MQIILLGNILNLGNIGDTVTVKNGYGRGICKQGKALRFNKRKIILKKKKELNKKNIQIITKFKEVSKLINKKTFKFVKEIRKVIISIFAGKGR